MRSLLLIIALIAVSFAAYSKKIPGMIISKGESREVTFELKIPLLSFEPNFERIQYKVKYYENGKKKTLRPDDADEIIFDYEGMEIRMISCENTIGGGTLLAPPKKIFLKLEIDGPLRLFRFYFKASSNFSAGPGMGGGTTYYTVDNLIFQKGNGPLKKPRQFGWKKDMLEYFSDCPALSERIESKDLKRKEIEEIVLYYNRHCGKK
jgi:hypothetical protein